MRWEDEHWRKIDTRETAAWASLEWQAQACVLLFIKTCEADGTICAPRGPSQVARLWRWPADIIQAGLEQLEQDGTITRIGGRYHMPNFAAAQAARTSASNVTPSRTAPSGTPRCSRTASRSTRSAEGPGRVHPRDRRSANDL